MMSASPEPAPETGGEPPRARGPILRYFDGEVALVKAFWLGGGLAMALAFYGLGRALFGQDSQGVGDTVLTYALFVLLFYLWIGVYGSAEQYIRAQQATPEVVWGYLARAFAVLKLVLITLSLLVVLFGGGASYYMW